MAGVYIHIPFCKSRCRYCDFFSTTQLEKISQYVQAVRSEWLCRRAELTEPIQTLYFGGGTPSLLPSDAIAQLVSDIATSDTVERTIEVNPGDITPPYLQALRLAGINRLSIGVQSFQDDLLQRIGRRHTAQQALDAIHEAQAAGLDNLSIDLMYGLPGQTFAQWQADVHTALSLGIQHLSSYCLSIEEGTVFDQMLRDGSIKELDDDTVNHMYDYLCLQTEQNGFEHYEVSNFALPGYRSLHNASYWDATPYLGLGAGAHSYDGQTRSWNISDLQHYIDAAPTGSWAVGREDLTDEQRYNEYVMLALRTQQGVAKARLQNPDIAIPYLQRGLLREHNGYLSATQEGWHLLNRIIEDLMI